jgi:hypothetical protein
MTLMLQPKMHRLRWCLPCWVMGVACILSTVEGQGQYDCPPTNSKWPCLRGTDGKPLTVRVLYMDKAFVTSNPAAVAKVTSMGKSYVPGTTCDNEKTAVPECFVFENWNGGWVGAYMNQVLLDLGVNVIALTKANFSAEARNVSTASSFTRCVWDVKFGKVDLCVGDFWETPERRNLTPFTAPIDSDFFTLYTTLNASAVKPPFDPQMFLSIFKPFDNSVWLLLVITTIVCTVAKLIVQGDFPPKRGAGATSRSICFDGTGTLAQGVWDTLMSFLGGEDPVVDSSVNWPSRFITIGIGIFVFIHVNSYTGSLAAYYVSINSVQLGQVTGLEDIKLQGGKLCLYQSMASATAQIISSVIPPSQTILMDNYGPMLEQLVKGSCSGAVVGKFETLTFIGAANVNFTVCTDENDKDNFAACADKTKTAETFFLNPANCGDNCKYARRFCDLVRLQDATISTITLSWEMPVSKALEPWVSFAMLRIHTAGNLSLYQNAEISEKNSVICPGPGSPSIAIGLEGLSGTFLFCGGTIVLALLAHIGAMAAAVASGRSRPAAAAAAASGSGAVEEDGVAAKGPDGERAAAAAGGKDAPLAGRLAEALEEVERILSKARQL